MTNDPAATAPVIRSANVAKPPAEAFRIFTEEIGAWWPLATHGLYGGASGGVAFRDGQLIETNVDGTENVWGEVLDWDPPKRLTMTWHPGVSKDDASHVDVTFEADGAGTRVVIEHHGWASFGEAAMARRRHYVGPGAWGHVLDHYADGTEPRPDAPELTDLAAAYTRFYDTAESGGFGAAPAEGEWGADETIAHVTLNDAAIVGVCQALIHQQEAHFKNITCQDPAVLAGWIESCADRTELIRRGRHQSQLVQAALARLAPDQLASEVECHLIHAGEVMVDGPRPWGAIAIEVQAGMHLPAHITQLENLR